MGDLGGCTFYHCLDESSITMGISISVWGFPYLILVLYLVQKYKGVYLYLFPFYLIMVLREVRETTTSLSVDS